MNAAQHGDKDVVDLLIEAGAEADRADENAMTALMYASRAGHKEVADALARAGA